MNRSIQVLIFTLFPLITFAQQCDWDGTAPFCAGECGAGKTEVTRASDLPDHWQDAFPVVQNTDFGEPCLTGTKALCCQATPGNECRWDGTAPFCDGSCGAGETESTPPAGSSGGAACWTGQKKYCCKAVLGRTRQPLTTNPALTLYASIWEQSSGPAWQARHGLDGQQYQHVFNQLVGQGYRPVTVSGYSVGGKATYAAVFVQAPGPQFFAYHGLSSDDYQREFDQRVREGYKPTFVDGFNTGGNARFNAIFEKASSFAFVARHGLDSAGYQQEFDRLLREGYRPTVVSGYNIGGADRYAAVWEQRSDVAWVARHGLTSAQFQQEAERLAREGFRIAQLSAWRSSKEPRYNAIWEKSAGAPRQMRHMMLGETYQSEFDELVRAGYRPVSVDGYHMYD